MDAELVRFELFVGMAGTAIHRPDSLCMRNVRWIEPLMTRDTFQVGVRRCREFPPIDKERSLHPPLLHRERVIAMTRQTVGIRLAKELWGGKER